MYTAHDTTTEHPLKDVPARLPLTILLALPDYVTLDPGAPLFNLAGAVTRLLGRFGWQRASKILTPVIWAPAWDERALERFVSTPFIARDTFFAGGAAARLAAADFPGTGGLRDLERPDVPRYEVVHVVGAVTLEDGEYSLLLSDSGDRAFDPAGLSAALTATRTRLLILHVPRSQHARACDLADAVVHRGGPAVVVVSGAEPSTVNAYLFDVYANIVHNVELDTALAPRRGLDQHEDDLLIDLYGGDGRSHALQFHGWLDELNRRTEELRHEVEDAVQRQAARADDIRRQIETYLHRDQVRAIEHRLDTTTARLDAVTASVSTMAHSLRRDFDWAHESGGAEPLSRIVETMAGLEIEVAEAARPYPELEAEVRASLEAAPRVLNANFGDPDVAARTLLRPDDALVAGRAYDLLVDVGPRWNTVPTLVKGHDAFPEDALPPSSDGHLIDAVFVSDDFEPRTATAKMWLPQGHGRSHPLIDGTRAASSGPVGMRLVAKAVSDGARGRARGRLMLFFENNLLQSAVVEARVDGDVDRAAPTTTDDASVSDLRNEIRVDYAQTASFADVGPALATRALRLQDGGPDSHDVRLSITVNDDGRGTHRIVVRHRDDVPPVWTAYDPSAALNALRDARRTLRECFCARDDDARQASTGDVPCTPVLDGANGKTRRQFLLDLFALARIGARLYAELVTQLRTSAAGVDAVAWERDFRRLMNVAGVIQVSRVDATPTQYSFPWALLYEYPLHGVSTDWRWCDVLTTEWSKEGRRDAPIAARCPYDDEGWHAANVLCPYGFWGLKHVIEQPLAAVRPDDDRMPNGAARDMPVGRDVHLSIAWTRDTALDLGRIDAHVQRLSGTRGVRLAAPPPNPADDREGVAASLRASNLAYFICHCEKDVATNQPYLYVGPRDDHESRKIYAATINAWARAAILDAWSHARPLVFINGCHSGDLEPGEVLNFVSQFGIARAAGIVATEVGIQVPLAIEVAERFFEKFVAHEGGRLGQAVREIRWELANKGNLLGLCYTAYGLADLRVVRT